MTALLALEDGTVFRGEGRGAPGTVTGEVCFNTGMTGYQEVLTDPSYHGQIVVMTAPQIGNTGVNEHDDQSYRPWVAGFVMRDASETFSSWRATGSLDAYLTDRGVPAVSGVDTRKLTRHIRSKGAMRGALSSEITDPDELIDVARSSPGLVGRDLAAEVSTATEWHWGAEDLERRAASGYSAGAERDAASAALISRHDGEPRKIAALDFGIKRNILDLLVASGCDVTVLPAATPPAQILAGGYDGVFLSNGPGDPEAVTSGIETVGALVGKIPIFGICLGHQILALALGAKTYKLPFGHRGSNHPVRKLGAGHIEITCQNHGFAVDPASVGETAARLSHVNLNDRTVEGMIVPGVAMSVQYHPEAGPGPHDSRYLFEEWHALMDTFEPTRVAVASPGST